MRCIQAAAMSKMNEPIARDAETLPLGTMCEHNRPRKASDDVRGDYALDELRAALRLLLSAASSDTEKPARKGLRAHLLRRAVTYIQHHLDASLRLTDIASAAGMTKLRRLRMAVFPLARLCSSRASS